MRLAALAFCLLLAPLARAEGLFAEASLGRASAELARYEGFTRDERSLTWSAGLGYAFNEYYAIEAGYRRLGEASISATAISGTFGGQPFSATGLYQANAEVDGWYAGPIIELPIGPYFINVRVGVYFWEAQINELASGTAQLGGQTITGTLSVMRDQTGADGYYGAGAGYAFSERTQAALSYTAYKVLEEGIRVRTLELRVRYRF